MVTKYTQQIMDECGYEDEMEFLEECVFDSIIPGICLDCETVTESCEPDMRKGWCCECHGNNVKSVLVLEGLI